LSRAGAQSQRPRRARTTRTEGEDRSGDGVGRQDRARGGRRGGRSGMRGVRRACPAHSNSPEARGDIAGRRGLWGDGHSRIRLEGGVDPLALCVESAGCGGVDPLMLTDWLIGPGTGYRLQVAVTGEVRSRCANTSAGGLRESAGGKYRFGDSTPSLLWNQPLGGGSTPLYLLYS